MTILTANIEELNGEELSRLLHESEAVIAAIERIRARARDILAAGRTVPGWRMLDVRHAAVIDHSGAFNRLWTDHGRDVAVGGIRLSLPAAAAALAKIAQIPRPAARKDIEKTLGGLVAFTDSPRLVRER